MKSTFFALLCLTIVSTSAHSDNIPEHNNAIWLQLAEWQNERLRDCGGVAHTLDPPTTEQDELLAAGWKLAGKTTFLHHTDNRVYWKEGYDHSTDKKQWIIIDRSHDGTPSHLESSTLHSCHL